MKFYGFKIFKFSTISKKISNIKDSFSTITKNTKAIPSYIKDFTLKNNVTEKETLLSWTNFLSKAESNSIIVCQPNNYEIALMGELSAETLKIKNIRGYISDGGCRDVSRIKSEIKLPVYCRFNTPKDVAGRWIVEEMGTSIIIGDVKIFTNDYLIADEDGIVIIPHQIINKIINKAKEDLNSENKMREAILDGTDPKEAYLKYGKF